MRLQGSEYEEYVHSLPVSTLVENLLGDENCRSTLQSAFADHDPHPDEVFIVISEGCSVLTNKRLFLIEDGELRYPPIRLMDIEVFRSSGLFRYREHIKLVDGTDIDRKVSKSVEDDAVTDLIQAAKDPSKIIDLGKTPSNDTLQHSIEIDSTFTEENALPANKSQTDGNCEICNQREAGAYSRAFGWLEKRVWETKGVVDMRSENVRYLPIGEVESFLCNKCVDKLCQRGFHSNIRMVKIFAFSLAALTVSVLVFKQDWLTFFAVAFGLILVLLTIGTAQRAGELRRAYSRQSDELRNGVVNEFLWAKIFANTQEYDNVDPHKLFNPNAGLLEWDELIKDEPHLKTYLGNGSTTYRYKISPEGWEL